MLVNFEAKCEQNTKTREKKITGVQYLKIS